MNIDILPGHSNATTLTEPLFGAITGEDFAVLPLFVAAHGRRTARWLPVATYEAILTGLATESAWQAGPWEPDTPDQATDRAEVTEALFGEQAAIMTRGEDS